MDNLISKCLCSDSLAPEISVDPFQIYVQIPIGTNILVNCTPSDENMQYLFFHRICIADLWYIFYITNRKDAAITCVLHEDRITDFF